MSTEAWILMAIIAQALVVFLLVAALERFRHPRITHAYNFDVGGGDAAKINALELEVTAGVREMQCLEESREYDAIVLDGHRARLLTLERALTDAGIDHVAIETDRSLVPDAGSGSGAEPRSSAGTVAPELP